MSWTTVAILWGLASIIHFVNLSETDNTVLRIAFASFGVLSLALMFRAMMYSMTILIRF